MTDFGPHQQEGRRQPRGVVAIDRGADCGLSKHKAAKAPAAGRLAAAMATIMASCRPIRDRVERSNEPNCRISPIPLVPAEQSVREQGRATNTWSRLRGRVEMAAKIAMRPSSGHLMAVVFLP